MASVISNAPSSCILRHHPLAAQTRRLARDEMRRRGCGSRDEKRDTKTAGKPRPGEALGIGCVGACWERQGSMRSGKAPAFICHSRHGVAAISAARGSVMPSNNLEAAPARARDDGEAVPANCLTSLGTCLTAQKQGLVDVRSPEAVMLYSPALRSEKSDSERLHVAGCLPAADGAKRGCHTQPGPFPRPPAPPALPRLARASTPPRITGGLDWLRCPVEPQPCLCYPFRPPTSTASDLTSKNDPDPPCHRGCRKALHHPGLAILVHHIRCGCGRFSAARSRFCLFPVLFAPFPELHRPRVTTPA